MQIKIYNHCPEDAMWVRITVFVDEQGFRDEFDEIDNIATHLLMLDDSDHPIATCRVFRKDNTDTYIIGRLAVVKEHRGKGLARLCCARQKITLPLSAADI